MSAISSNTESWSGHTHAEVETHIKSRFNNLSSLVSITYANLKTLKTGGNLVPGTSYRITDYSCTTTQTDTASAGHVFDIIVTADSASVLNENACAIQHEGDTYFANSNLRAWELKYTIDNPAIYSWVSDASSHKGVIYWMKDENNNEAPYDFKNILYAPASGETPSVYTFSYVEQTGPSSFTYTDSSLNSRCHDNIIKSYMNSSTYAYVLNNNTILNGYNYPSDNFFDYNCYNNKCTVMYSDGYQGVKLGCGCFNNTISSSYNTLGNSCSNNVFLSGMGYGYNILGDDCSNNTNIGKYWILGNGCSGNSHENPGAGDFSTNIIFGNGCSNNTFKSTRGPQNIIFGNNCSLNQLYYCNYVIFGNGCQSNIINSSNGVQVDNITLGNSCTGNNIDRYCKYITLENGCSNITIGRESLNCHFGEGCSNIKFGNSGSVKNFYNNIVVEPGNKYIYLYCSATTAYETPYQNVTIEQGVNNTTTWKTITDANVNQTYKTTYQPTNSQIITV